MTTVSMTTVLQIGRGGRLAVGCAIGDTLSSIYQHDYYVYFDNRLTETPLWQRSAVSLMCRLRAALRSS